MKNETLESLLEKEIKYNVNVFSIPLMSSSVYVASQSAPINYIAMTTINPTSGSFIGGFHTTTLPKSNVSLATGSNFSVSVGSNWFSTSSIITPSLGFENFCGWLKKYEECVISHTVFGYTQNGYELTIYDETDHLEKKFKLNLSMISRLELTDKQKIRDKIQTITHSSITS